MKTLLGLPILMLFACVSAVRAADDLNPVRFKAAPSHPPVVLAQGGQAMAVIACGDKDLSEQVKQLQSMIEKATGAKLPIVEKAGKEAAIIVGDCEEAAGAGLEGAKMPVEGFAIKTAPGRAYIVGNASGRKWGVYEFLERFVGVRWYFPPADIGLSIPSAKTLALDPVWLEDAPVFRNRYEYPPYMKPIQQFLRSENSWPVKIAVHQPAGLGESPLKDKCPEIFQQQSDGTRNFGVLCYSNPRTLEVFLEHIQCYVDGKLPDYAKGKAYNLGIVDKAVTVSPADIDLACYCPECRRLWDDKGGQSGSASRVMATFVDRLAREIEKRWPDQGFTVIFLPYKNYQAAPEGFKFPGNVEVQICGMPGMACYKEPAIRDREQANIDRWVEISGRKIQGWDYSCWPADKTYAAYQYPHVVKDFYVRNRDKTVGSFINGTADHWPRQHISLYCWLKCQWNPDFNVDAAVDTFCERMFGSAAKSMRELVGMQIDCWEKSTWPGGRFSAKGVYESSFPRETVKKMEEIFQRAREEAKDDTLVMKRLDYCAPALNDFFKESKDLGEGTGLKPLKAVKVGEDPTIDGRLDDKAWELAEAVPFVKADGKDFGKAPDYPTELKAVWTLTGITFGFRMSEPEPDKLVTKNGGHDNGALWWDDNVEIFLDVTGRKEGEFYQFIINANCDIWDSKQKDNTWECNGVKCKSFRGKDFWSLEVFLPYSAFPETTVKTNGPPVPWAGNFTRHRISSGPREYQRMNTLGSKVSANLADFAPISFIE